MKRIVRLLSPALSCVALVTMMLAPSSLAAPQAQTPTTPDKLDWPYYGNDPGNMRYVNVDQINPSNVAQLSPVWMFHLGVGTERTSFESQPIVVDGTLYVSSPHNHVYALDAATGALKWTYNPEMPSLWSMAICCGQTNRGVAVGGGKVFVGQLDANLVALDASNGQIVWKTAVDDWRERWTETMAPQYIDGKVLIGASGGEFERRGHISAYDANTGNMLWRFYTVPGPGEVGHESWEGDSWRFGGATVWTTPSVDPALGMVYLSTGNAAPDLDGSSRGGDNLFAASVVALDLSTGAYKWHFQEVHHDIWDYDSPQPTHLFTLEKDGQQVPALGHANKNGFYFILDRRDGKPLYEVTEVPVPTNPTWQKASPTQPQPATDPLIPHAVDQPVPNYQSAPFWTPPSEIPQVVQPGAESGPEWPPAAYSPRTKYSYIPAGGYEPWIMQAIPNSPNSLGSTLSDRPSYPPEFHYGLFDALDTTTGKIAWQMKVPERAASGITVAGDLVFLGESNGRFHAVDAKSGTSLWSYKSDAAGVGGANGAPAVYVVGGREYVVMGFGGNTQVRSGQTSPPGDALIAFALPQGGQQSAPNVVTANPRPIEVGGIPESALQPITKSAPADGSTVVPVEARDIHFYPDLINVAPGQKIAIHVTNTESNQVAHNFAIGLESGLTGMQGNIPAGEEGYFLFTAPSQPGEYAFWCDVGSHRFLGMTGTLTVALDAGQVGMPRTGGGWQAETAWLMLLWGVVLLAGILVHRRARRRHALAAE